jgi:hypothetical protein
VAGFGFIDAQYFRVLVEGGAVGMVCFLWLLWRLLGMGHDAWHRLRGTRFEALPLAFLAALAAMVTHAIGANTFIIVRIMEPFWFFAAIVTILPDIAARSLGTPKPAGAQTAGLTG